jgi:hypothetical protein
MRKKMMLMLCLICVSLTNLFSSESVKKYAFVNSNNLRMRAEPNTNSKIVEYLHKMEG